MNTGELISIIQAVGFPIVACGALFWYNVKVVASIKQTIEENTKALTKLMTLFEYEGEL